MRGSGMTYRNCHEEVPSCSMKNFNPRFQLSTLLANALGSSNRGGF